MNETGFYGNIFIILATYLRKLAIPADLSVVYLFKRATSLLDPRVAAGVGITVVAAVFSYIAFKKDKLVFFCLLFIMVPLLPCLYIPAITGPSMLGERYLYLPSAGFVMLVSLMISRLAKWNRRAAVSGFLALATLFFAMTAIRNADWKNEYTLWADVARKAPESAFAHNNLGAALIERGMYGKAQEELSHAIALKPEYAEAHNNLGYSLLKSNMYNKALAEFSQAIALKPDYTVAYINRGLAYAGLGRDDLAVGEYLSAMKCDPSAEDTYDYLGISYRRLGEFDKSIEAFEAALRLDPDYADADNDLGDVFLKKGDLKSAIGCYQAAVRLEPENPRFRKNLEKTINAAQHHRYSG